MKPEEARIFLSYTHKDEKKVMKLYRQLKDAARGQFDLVVFWSLDRFSREGINKTLQYLQLFDSHGIKFHSYTEEFLHTDTKTKQARDEKQNHCTESKNFP